MSMTERSMIVNTLKTIVDNVYFQRPDGADMIMPCANVELAISDRTTANNKTYLVTKPYTVTIFVKKNPEKYIDSVLRAFSYARMTGSYVSDGFHHLSFEVSIKK